MYFDTAQLSNAQLVRIIQMQTEIAKFGLDLGGVMQFVTEQMPGLTGADGAAIELAEGDEMVYRATSGMAGPQIGLRLKIAASLSGRSIGSGETFVCDDSETDPRVDRDACRRVGLRSMLVMPLKHGSGTVGVLKVMSKRPNGFGPADIALLGLLSEVVASSMHFSTTYHRDDLFIQATHDGLTGLANRALFMDRLRTALGSLARGGSPLAVLVIDLDGLKAINDSDGHRVGDAVLVEFARRLACAARKTDTVARLGGDEFAVILMPIQQRADVEDFMRRLSAALETPFAFEDRRFPLKASMGAAISPAEGGDLVALVELADQRMYADKRRRKAETASA